MANLDTRGSMSRANWPTWARPQLVLPLCGAAALLAPLAAQAPSGYYRNVDTSSPSRMRTTLHTTIDDHRRYKYTDTATDTWDILELADEHPTNTSRILDVYRNASYPKYTTGNSSYDREHSWPSSYGFPKDNTSNYPYTDCHHLFLAYGSYNRSRSNKPFENGSGTEKPTLYNAGIGGGSGRYPGNSNWTATGRWETWRSRRGDIARALFYMDVRYEGGVHGTTGKNEPNLVLTDNVSLISASNTGSNISTAYMGKLSTLLQWHREDPVDARERNRNDVIYMFQGNRNPFIDHPEWVDCIFTGSCSGGGGGGGTSTAWINEFHYDDRGADQGEFVEIAGTAGLSLSGWKVYAYNGNGGRVYATRSLSGSIPNQQNGFGTVSVSFTGLQNGAPDGIALVDGQNRVVQFLSYEGTLVANDGPARGRRSTDVGVRETSSTNAGYSLQLTGTGSQASDFRWQSPRIDSPGARNSGQTFR